MKLREIPLQVTYTFHVSFKGMLSCFDTMGVTSSPTVVLWNIQVVFDIQLKIQDLWYYIIGFGKLSLIDGANRTSPVSPA